MRKYQILSLLLIFLLILVSIDVDAQRRTRRAKKSTAETTIPFNQKFWYGINMGNLQFFNGRFSFSNKFSAAYKLNNNFSGGLTMKSFLDIIQVNNGSDINLFSYGLGAFTRYKISTEIFIQAEYDITSYDELISNFGSTDRKTYSYPLVGGGYESGIGPWTYGLNMLFIVNEEVRELNVKNSFAEWWLSFSYNF